MKKLIAILALATGLTGCVTINPNVITPQQVIVAANGFDALESTATHYLKLPVCGVAPCRDPNVTVTLAKAVRAARGARTQLEKYVNANPGSPIPVTLYQTVSVAVSTLQNLLVSNNIN